MNAALLAVILLLVAGLLSFLWFLLGRQATRMDSIEARLRTVEMAVTELDAKVDVIASTINARMDVLEASLGARITALEVRFDTFEAVLTGFEASLAKILDTVQGIDTRLARLEGAQT